MQPDTTANMPPTAIARPSDKHKRILPDTDIDLGDLCNFVGQHWQQNKWLVLHWLSADKFLSNTHQYNSLVRDKRVQRSSRPTITGDLKRLDTEINNATAYVKGYLAEKYGKEMAANYYAAFGIAHNREGRFRIPKDRTQRSESLAQMLKGIALENFTNKTYGTGFWDSIKQKFDSYLEQAINTDSGVSAKTGDKNLLRKELRKALNALVHALKAHFPDTWKTELRGWGFQKEKY